MDFYVIPPHSEMGLMERGDRVFALAQHYLANSGYRDYIKHLKSKGMWITLDSGIGDYAPVTAEQLLKAALDLMPNEVIPLDILFDADQTLKNLQEFKVMMQEAKILGVVEIFSCPQGETKEDWLRCYKEMLQDEDVKTIGFSKIAIPHAWNTGKDDQGIMEARHLCYNELMEQNLIIKPIHCLGAGDPREFLLYRDNSLMRSTDSCFSVWAGMNMIEWSKGDFTRIKTPHDYFNRPMSPLQIQIAIENIEFLQQIVKHKPNEQASIQS